MTTISLPVEQPSRKPPGGRALRIALVGNPNCGKTTLFNRLTGMRAKTSNFPGTTLECRSGKLTLDEHDIELVDLPGLYSAKFGQSEELLAAGVLHGALPGADAPDAVVVVIDATCLSRHLYLASEVREMGLPLVVALNMMDEARRQGQTICLETLGKELDATVIPISGRTGDGIDSLRQAMLSDLVTGHMPDPNDAQRAADAMSGRIACTSCTSCPHTDRHKWACGVGLAAGEDQGNIAGAKTESADRVLTHPVLGLVSFTAIMAGLFILLFKLAAYPMDWIDAGFGALGGWVGALLPEGLINSFVVDGLIGGVGGVVIFLPQICLLFFVLTLLEDTGYLARAAFVADRIMQKVGLPGKAFIPMLSAHACAIPAIMATKTIESRRDRLITILVLPLMTCSARLPVYAMIIALLFAGNALLGGLVFYGAYTLGIVAAMVASFILGKTILKGKPQELVIELPPYRWPSLRVALLTVWDRALIFLKQAGTVILLISVILWVLLTFPQSPDGALPDIATPDDIAQYETYEAEIGYLSPRLKSLEAELGPEIKTIEEELGPQIEALEASLQPGTDRINRGIERLTAQIDDGDISDESVQALADLQAKLEEFRAPLIELRAPITARQNQLDELSVPLDDAMVSRDNLHARYATEYSLAGRMGKTIEPVFEPLGFDWRIDIGVVASFAAREVVVSTLAIVGGVGEDGAEDEDTLVAMMRGMKRPDGSPLFTMATSLSLLVFFVPAMQCLPTQAVTRRETGSWKWAFLQFGYMTVFAYVAALMTYQVVAALT